MILILTLFTKHTNLRTTSKVRMLKNIYPSGHSDDMRLLERGVQILVLKIFVFKIKNILIKNASGDLLCKLRML